MYGSGDRSSVKNAASASAIFSQVTTIVTEQYALLENLALQLQDAAGDAVGDDLPVLRLEHGAAFGLVANKSTFDENRGMLCFSAGPRNSPFSLRDLSLRRFLISSLCTSWANFSEFELR